MCSYYSICGNWSTPEKKEEITVIATWNAMVGTGVALQAVTISPTYGTPIGVGFGYTGIAEEDYALNICSATAPRNSR